MQDYRPLNKWTKKNRNVSPLIPSVVDRLAGCTLFTKFDIRWGYNNIRIKPGDEWKAAFLTPEGLFEPTVMFFGLTNSPATFQMMMNTIFRQPVMLGWFSIFMDDGVIHTRRKPGETEEQHIARHRKIVHEIFDILAENDLYLKPEKCAFEQEEIEYLGVIIGKGRLRMDPKKLHAVLNYPTPCNATDIRAFLGFTGYYRYFVKNYSGIVRPLLALTRKSATFHWGKDEQAAFDEIRTIMCKACDNRISTKSSTSKPTPPHMAWEPYSRRRETLPHPLPNLKNQSLTQSPSSQPLLYLLNGTTTFMNENC